MSHRRSSLAAIAVSAAILVGACGGEPALPDLTDPTEILAAAATEAAGATSVHLDVAVDGELRLDLTGGGVGAPIQLTNTTLNADLDLASGSARITFAAAVIPGLRGELIVAGGTAYVKSGLTGKLYQAIAIDGVTPPDPNATPGTSPDAASFIAALADVLAQPGLDPVKGDDTECGTTTCYQVTVTMTPEDVAALVAGGQLPTIPIPAVLPIPIPDLGDIGLEFVVRIEKPTRRLAGLTVAVTAADAGQATIETRLSKWNEGVSISVPPPDEVTGAR